MHLLNKWALPSWCFLGETETVMVKLKCPIQRENSPPMGIYLSKMGTKSSNRTGIPISTSFLSMFSLPLQWTHGRLYEGNFAFFSKVRGPRGYMASLTQRTSHYTPACCYQFIVYCLSSILSLWGVMELTLLTFLHIKKKIKEAQ